MTKLFTEPFAKYDTRGAKYTADAAGMIYASTHDVGDLVNSGCVVVSDKPVPSAAAQANAFDGLMLTLAKDGSLYRLVEGPIGGNKAGKVNDVLGGFVLPANAFATVDKANDGIRMTFSGKYGANTHNKRVRVWANPVMVENTVKNGVLSGGKVTAMGKGHLLMDTGVVADDGTAWELDGVFVKPALGSSTQMFQSSRAPGAKHEDVSLPISESAMNIVITGFSADGTANDVVLDSIQIRVVS